MSQQATRSSRSPGCADLLRRRGNVTRHWDVSISSPCTPSPAIMALGGALFERVVLDHGRLASPLLASYRVPRFSDVPAIDVVLVSRPGIPSAGAGETPLIAVAPAVANAIFAATGRRLRSLPLIPGGCLPGEE